MEVNEELLHDIRFVINSDPDIVGKILTALDMPDAHFTDDQLNALYKVLAEFGWDAHWELMDPLC